MRLSEGRCSFLADNISWGCHLLQCWERAGPHIDLQTLMWHSASQRGENCSLTFLMGPPLVKKESAMAKGQSQCTNLLD